MMQAAVTIRVAAFALLATSILQILLFETPRIKGAAAAEQGGGLCIITDASQCRPLGIISPDGSFQVLRGLAGLRLASADTNTTHLGTVADPSSAKTLLRHFYSGQLSNTSFVRDDVAASENEAEQTAMFRMTSNTGFSSGVKAYKMAAGAESTCGSRSAPCWGMTTVLTTTAGYRPSNIQVTHEFDQNNDSGMDCVDGDIGVGAVPCGTILLTGASSNQLTFGIAVSGYRRIRNGIQFDSDGPVVSDLRSYSVAQSMLLDSGVHKTGIDLRGKYASAAITAPGFRVASDGAVKAASLESVGSVASAYGRFMPMSYAGLTAKLPCNAEREGTYAYILDAERVIYGATPIGGGHEGSVVVCARSDARTFGWKMH